MYLSSFRIYISNTLDLTITSRELWMQFITNKNIQIIALDIQVKLCGRTNKFYIITHMCVTAQSYFESF